jgi:hypothetical protein
MVARGQQTERMRLIGVMTLFGALVVATLFVLVHSSRARDSSISQMDAPERPLEMSKR